MKFKQLQFQVSELKIEISQIEQKNKNGGDNSLDINEKIEF